MAGSLKEAFLAGGNADNKENTTGFDELRSTIATMTEQWRRRAKGRTRVQDGGPAGAADNRARWRKKLGEALESTAAHAFILGLLLLDLLATVVDVLHTLGNDSRDLRDCIAMVEACQCTPSFEQSESWEFLYWIGMGVLCILALNILGLLVALGPGAFFRHPGYILDLVVVVTALCLEIFLDSETAGLLVILNLWRIVRVAHGVFEVTDEAWEKEVHKLQEQVQAVEASHQRDLLLLSLKERRIQELEGQLQQEMVQRRRSPSSSEDPQQHAVEE